MKLLIVLLYAMTLLGLTLSPANIVFDPQVFTLVGVATTAWLLVRCVDETLHHGRRDRI
jgi:hypothetical protein